MLSACVFRVSSQSFRHCSTVYLAGEAVVSGTRAVADSPPGLPSADGWRLGEMSGSFGISLAAEGG